MICKQEQKYIELERETIKNEKYIYDIGLAILRPILAFLVVMTHCYDYNGQIGKWRKIIKKTNRFRYHVQIFFIISFYFSHKTLTSLNYKKLFERIQRLCIPYFLWPIIFFLLNKLLLIFSIAKKEIKLNNLKNQLLYVSGDMNMDILWFQWNLILITILFIIIIFIFRKKSNFIFTLINIPVFIYQYNEKNFDYFSKYNGHKRLVFGRILEMIPYAIIGFLISSSNIINFFKKQKLKTIIFCICLIYFLLNYQIFKDLEGHGYPGFKIYFISICIFIIFEMFPSEKIQNKTFITIIKQITGYTAGIYYIHSKLTEYISNYNIFIKKKTLKGCVIIYLICYLISFVGNLIFGKKKLRHLFI